MLGVDYNRIKKGHIFDLRKILYIFICDDKTVLNDIYEGDSAMNKVREDLDRITWERDAVLYYNPDDLNRQIIEEKVDEKVNEKVNEIIEERLEEAVNEKLEKRLEDEEEKLRKEGIIETTKKMKKLNISIDDIKFITGLTIDEINNL